MKITRKNLAMFLGILFLCMFIGTLLWEVLERAVSAAGRPFSLSIGPFGFDAGVLAFWVRANPGTALGVPGALLLYRSL